MNGPAWDNLGQSVATIEKRAGKSGNTWRVRIRRAVGSPLTKSFRRKADAEEWARGIEHKLDTGDQVPSSEARKRTLADAIDKYVTDVLPRARRAQDSAKRISLLNFWRAVRDDARGVGEGHRNDRATLRVAPRP